jgi:hypothetical protein
MYKRLILIVMIALLALSACAAAPRSENTAASEGGFAAPSAPEMMESEMYDRDNRGILAPVEMPAAEPGPAGQVVPEARRLVIRNANLTIVVDDPAQAMTTISRMAEEMEGFVVSSNLYKRSNESGREFPEANINVRVPAERLNEAMDLIKALVRDPLVDVRAENVSGQDVTKEYTDLQSRLTNLEETEKQLREILGSATRTEDVLAVHYQLTQIREQIEVIKGQIKYYEESAALSSIAVTIQAQAAVQPIEIGGWQPVGVARNAVQALVDTLQVLGGVAIWLILYVLPVLLLIFIPLRLLWLLFRRTRKNGSKVYPTPPPPSASA